MDSQLLTVLVTLGSAALTVAAAYAVRYAAKRPQLGEVSEAAQLLVEAAEQMFADREGREKLAWALGELQRRFGRIDAGLLRTVVEAAVYRLNQEQGAAGQSAQEAAPADGGRRAA